MLDVWRAADDIELFESGWTFDHFYPIFSDSNGPCLEGWTVTTALAQATTRLRVGVLVTGIHYRHVAVLANMAAALDIVSGGRLELGVGAGWNVEESEAYGIELGTLTERFDRFDEALEVLVSLLTNEHTTFDGSYYQLTNARNEPKPDPAAAPAHRHRRHRTEAHPALGGPLGPALEPSGHLGRGVEDGAATRSTPTAPISAATRPRSRCRPICATTRRRSVGPGRPGRRLRRRRHGPGHRGAARRRTTRRCSSRSPWPWLRWPEPG